MNKWTTLPNKETIDRTIDGLKKKNVEVYLVETEHEAKKKFFEILPEGAEILNNSSTTLDMLGISEQITNSGKYDSVKNKLMSMDRQTQSREMQRIGAAPEWSTGSAHAITQDGEIMIASNTGSQIPGYAYGSDHVVLVVGTQKIVENRDEGIKRIYEHSLVLESERVKKAYGMPRSHVRRLFVLEEEASKGRTTVIFVNKVIGF